MNDNFVNHITSLLYEEEGSSLDFKVAQYPFEGADQGTKSEILKDILTFSNAWRRADAYILIGVEEVRGGKSIVHGVKTHLPEADLQQFVNKKTNRPIEFSYRVCLLEDKEIGVIHIPVQERPTYLRKRFGPLNAGDVHIRRGSSSEIAAPEEIAGMGAADSGQSSQNPVLEIVFLNAASFEPEGKELAIEVRNIAMPDENSIPDYGTFTLPFAGRAIHHDPSSNRSYYRDLAAYVVDMCGLHELTIQVENQSGITAQDVTLRICVDDKNQVLCFKDQQAIMDHPTTSFFPHLRGGGFGVTIQGYEIRKLQDSWMIDYSIGKIQPLARATIPGLYVGAAADCAITLPCQLFADNLPNPLQQNLCVAVTVSEVEMTVQQLTSLSLDDE